MGRFRESPSERVAFQSETLCDKKDATVGRAEERAFQTKGPVHAEIPGKE